MLPADAAALGVQAGFQLSNQNASSVPWAAERLRRSVSGVGG